MSRNKKKSPLPPFPQREGHEDDGTTTKQPPFLSMVGWGGIAQRRALNEKTFFPSLSSNERESRLQP